MTPQEKALALLRDVLPEEARRDLDTKGFFQVRGSAGGKYTLRMGRYGNVIRQADGRAEKLCIHPTEDVPDADTVLAQVLLLWMDEPAFLSTANSHGVVIETPTLAPLVDGRSAILPSVPDDAGMARVRLIARHLETPEGREALATVVVARIRYGPSDNAAVAAEVTSLARTLLVRHGDGPLTENLAMLAHWLVQATLPPA